jgi:acetyl esterase/lipase
MKALKIFLLTLICLGSAVGQLSNNSKWTKGLKDKYYVKYNIVYSNIDTASCKLDVYVPKEGGDQPVPVLLWIHGGGWNRLSKDSVSGQIVPYLELGWVVVNIDYRLTGAALAPAAVEDCRCALRWIYEHSTMIRANTKKIVVSGTSAGGHLALMTGMLPNGTEMDRLCPGNEQMKIAAIINFYGPTDLNDLMAEANRRGYAVKWIGNQPNKEEIAHIVSPLTYVRKDIPPIFSIHGDADPTVPYSQAVRLHDALRPTGVMNRLMTIPGGVHGKFTKEQNAQIHEKIMEFLSTLGIVDGR